MGQKVNPHGFRVGVIDDWDSKWFADKDYQKYLLEDIKIREFIKDKQFQAGISRVAIERTEQKMRISIYTAKPGIVIGRQGSNIELLKKDLAKLTDSKLDINIIEVKSPDMDATLVAENVAGQLERRIAFRRAMKQCVGRTMRLGAKGIKITCSGRLGGAEIAVPNLIVTAAFPCTPCVPTLTMVLLKPIPPMAASASRYGSIKVKFSRL